MRYRKFTIQGYRGIVTPLEIDLLKKPLHPIVGVNESGKTTILQAIFAFDRYNDHFNDSGRHLQDVTNLVELTPGQPMVSAEIECTYSEYARAVDDIGKSPEISDALKAKLKGYRLSPRKQGAFPGVFSVTRNVHTKRYSIDLPICSNPDLNDLLGAEIVRWLPYILYFDDFRDSIEERIEITKEADGGVSGWLAIMEELFKQTDRSYSVFDLAAKEDRQRKSMLDRVKRRLNSTLTAEWQHFRLDDTESLEINIEYEPNVLKLDVVEKDAQGYGHYFFIRDRSKGFYWFFNFVMKLEFNPKTLSGSGRDTIYLLDEPGSYLHASAQRELCKKLKHLSERNRVIYCTHSHYLLDPEVIPLNSISVAEKKGAGNIVLVPIHEYRAPAMPGVRSAYQPVQDALQLRPFLIDMAVSRVIITEGITDYYAFEMFKKGRKVNVFPSSGAENIRVHISNMIAWRVPFFALWDNDTAGQEAKRKAEGHFGAEMAKDRFFLLPQLGTKSRTSRLEDLFDEADKVTILNALGIVRYSDFKKVIDVLYYSPQREAIIRSLSPVTQANFDAVFTTLGIT